MFQYSVLVITIIITEIVVVILIIVFYTEVSFLISFSINGNSIGKHLLTLHGSSVQRLTSNLKSG